MGILMTQFEDNNDEWTVYEVDDVEELEYLIKAANGAFKGSIMGFKYIDPKKITKMSRTSDKLLELLDKEHIIIGD